MLRANGRQKAQEEDQSEKCKEDQKRLFENILSK